METISVGEYAERRGISVQAVYKKLKSPQFKPYIQKTSDGKTRLDIAILDDTKINLNSTKHSTKHSTVEQPFNQPFNQPFKQPISQDVSEDSLNLDSTVDSTVEQPSDSTVEQPFKRSETASESDLITFLASQIEIKDKLIQELTGRMKDAYDSLKEEQARHAETQKSLQFEQGKNRDLEEKLSLLKAPDPQPEEPEQQGTGFRKWFKSLWNTTAPKP